MKLCPACQRCYDDTDSVCSFDEATLVPSRHGSRMIAEKYHLERLLGRGGMGAVYAATHVDLERPVAIKLLLPNFTADQDALERFRREARAAARLNHPNVADTYDYGSLPDGGAYIVMELVDGMTLRERMNAGGPLPFREAVSIMRQVANGVEAAHRSGITHRDLKPSNIILSRDHDNLPLAKVVDFSVAKLKEGNTSGAALTATGSLIGTPRYMAPEQCADNKTDARSDIYSMGVILFEMLAGRPPFEAPTTTGIAIKHIQEPPPPLEEFRADTPEPLSKLVMQSLAKAPSERPQTAQEFGNRLREAAAGLPQDDSLDSTMASTTDASTADGNVNRGPQTNPVTREGSSDTGRAGEPTSEDSLSKAGAGDPASVQSYAVEVAEQDKEVETKVSPAAESRSVKAGAQDQEQLESEGAATSAEAAGDFPLLSQHSGAATEAATARTEETANATSTTEAPADKRSYLVYVAAALLLFAVGAGTFYLASRQSSTRNNVDDGKAAADKSAAPNPRQSNSDSQTTNQQGALSDAGNASSSQAAKTESADARTELATLLDQWVAATVARNLDQLISFYPPVVDVFYLKRRVPRAAVRAEKQRMLAQAESVEIRASQPETTVSEDGRTATMLFRKSWNFRGPQPSTGEVLQELRWMKTNEGWKITSERDLDVVR